MKKDNNTDTEQFLFTQNNYKILLISLFFLALGFILMIGGGGQTDFDFTGPVNQAIQTFGDASNGNVDKRSDTLTVYIRSQKNDQGIKVLRPF